MDLKNYKGVLHGDQVQELFEAGKKHQFALPAVNVTGTNTINAVMETAKAVNSPVIIQLSNGGAQFYAGKSLDNSKLQASQPTGQPASIAFTRVITVMSNGGVNTA